MFWASGGDPDSASIDDASELVEDESCWNLSLDGQLPDNITHIVVILQVLVRLSDLPFLFPDFVPLFPFLQRIHSLSTLEIGDAVAICLARLNRTELYTSERLILITE